MKTHGFGEKTCKGIILAVDNSRYSSAAKNINPCNTYYGKPLIYYSITTLIQLKVNNIAIVCLPDDAFELELCIARFNVDNLHIEIIPKGRANDDIFNIHSTIDFCSDAEYIYVMHFNNIFLGNMAPIIDEIGADSSRKPYDISIIKTTDYIMHKGHYVISNNIIYRCNDSNKHVVTGLMRYKREVFDNNSRDVSIAFNEFRDHDDTIYEVDKNRSVILSAGKDRFDISSKYISTCIMDITNTDLRWFDVYDAPTPYNFPGTDAITVYQNIFGVIVGCIEVAALRAGFISIDTFRKLKENTVYSAAVSTYLDNELLIHTR